MKNFVLTFSFALIGFLAMAPVTAHQAHANVVPVPATSPFVPTSTASIGAPPVSFEVNASALQSGWWAKLKAWARRQACRIEVNHYDSEYNQSGLYDEEIAALYSHCDTIRAS